MQEQQVTAKDYILSEAFYRYCLALRIAFQKSGRCLEEYDVLDLEGACADAASIIWTHLKELGISSTYVDGEFRGNNHCWSQIHLGVRSYVVDITATQFDRSMPPVLITAKNQIKKWYRVGVESDNPPYVDLDLHSANFRARIAKRARDIYERNRIGRRP